MNMKPIRQGDVLLIPVDVIPPSTAKTVNQVVLAEGEITGHNHKLTAEKGVLTWDDFVCVAGEDNGYLSHEDHDPIPAPVVPPGIVFRVVRQKEFTLDEQWTPVQD